MASVRVGQPGNVRLFRWARELHDAFGVAPVLVGSATETKAWRDVDVRLILSDDMFRDRVGNPTNYLEPRRSAMNIAFSIWGQQSTGLPIDFQFQTESESATHDKRPISLEGFYRHLGDQDDYWTALKDVSDYAE